MESDGGRKLASALIKQLTGNDVVTARFLFSEFFDIEPTWKVWFSTNHRPTITDDGDALWDRVRLIPCTVRIAEAEQDRDLLRKLLAELPGILAWAVQGCLRWQREGLGCPSVVRAATASYREAESTFDHFLAERYVCDPHTSISFSELRQVYADWSAALGDKPMSSKAFGAALQERGFTPMRLHNARHYAGLRVRTATDDPADATMSTSTPHPPPASDESVDLFEEVTDAP
jgi:putative DNA primase/helicase